MKRYSGIRERSPGSYEVNFRPFKGSRRVILTVKATSDREAYQKRAELMVDAAKQKPVETDRRAEETFESIWPVLERNLVSDGLTHKTRLSLKRVYNRLFTDFRLKRYPHITVPNQLTLPFFLEYKSYYGVELNRVRGLRAETQRLKMIMHRLRRLRYCNEAVISELKEIKTPEGNKKAYPDLNLTSIKLLFSRIKNERPDLYGPIYFMLRTGRRVEETTLIERKDIVWDGINPIKINIRAEITKMGRSAPLNYLDQDLQSHIRNYYQQSNKHKAPNLFLNQQFKKINQKRITKYLGDLTLDMFKVKITAHYFRHRFCTETCKAKLPLIDIQAISGIKNIDVLIGNYCHSSVEGQASVLERTQL